MISVVILTRNEEKDLPGCLESVRFSDDVHVFDSCSTDGTVEIARRMGAHVHLRVFDTYAAQRNAALQGIAFRNPWVFVLDADERLNPELWQEALECVAAAPASVAAFRVRRDDYFLGHHLRYTQMMAFYTRLVRVGRAQYTRDVNEFLAVDGETAQLHQRFRHDSFSKGLHRWFEKHNVYSSMEARIVAAKSYAYDASLRTAFFHADFHTRRRAQKALFYRLPGRPVLRWLWLLVVRGGVLDGRAGLIYATLQAAYEWQIVLKTRELLREQARRRACRSWAAQSWSPAVDAATCEGTAAAPRSR